MIVFRIKHEVRSLFLNRVPEWVGALALFGLGADLCRHIDIFAVSPVYAILSHVASQASWSFAALTISTVRLIALILNGFFPIVRRLTPAVRCVGALGGAAVWFAIAIGFALENTSILGIVAHSGLGALDLSYAIIVAHEAAITLKQGLSYRANRS